MKNSSLRINLVVAIAVGAIVAGTAGVAHAGTYLQLNGSAPGQWESDRFYTNTSPLLLDDPNLMYDGFQGWYNQSYVISPAPVIMYQPDDPDADQVEVPLTSLGVGTWPEPGVVSEMLNTPFPQTYPQASPDGVQEGLFRFLATGSLTDPGSTQVEAEARVGIDKTRPTSHAFVMSLGSASIYISADDALSGVQCILYGIDDQPEMGYVTWDPDHLTVHTTVTSAGSHTLRYCAIDNASNVQMWKYTSFSVSGGHIQPVLSLPSYKGNGSKRTFSGSTTPFDSPMTVTLTVQRRSGSSWKSYASVHATVAAYAAKYSISKSITKHGTYRVRVSEGTSKSSWSKSFAVK